uniref:Uncharacterized protein n=1 Tax=Arundo donax TaxID=35708 RepID=A0A0A9DA87_ARUDO
MPLLLVHSPLLHPVIQNTDPICDVIVVSVSTEAQPPSKKQNKEPYFVLNNFLSEIYLTKHNIWFVVEMHNLANE